MQICGLEFTPYSKDNIRCSLENSLPNEKVLYYPLKDGALFAVPAVIGIDPHPLLPFFEAAVYKDGAWIVGIDFLKNEYFTPTSEQDLN
ncbi:MAG: hypothetical protein IJE10_08530 [Clostridia bacterium]|nr:hypothetical protein [Clostridia bacterium]